MARDVEEQLGEILTQVEEQYRQPSAATESEGEQAPGTEATEGEEEAEEPEAVPRPVARRSASRKRIEELFDAATRDRSKAFELKQGLDRLGLFKEYEDRFLDLFKKTE